MKSRIRLLAVVALAALVSTGVAQKKPLPKALDAAFDASIDSVMKTWKVPGIGIAVVKGNQVIMAKGYGFRDLEQKVPVTGKTKFAIGSVSKSFTVTGLAVQAGQGKFDWDQPVRRYLPDFMMYDPVATERMTPRDLVTHRSGLPRHDVVWGAGGLSRDQIYQRLRYFPNNRDFRSVWQYQNLMYLTAGVLSGKLAGTSWEEVIRTTLFQPLGMTTSDFSVNAMQKSPDFSFGYARLPNDSVTRIPFQVIDEIGPAGSINSSVEEMARYLAMHMQGGKLEGKTIVPAAQVFQMHAPQMVMPASQTPGPGGIELGHQQYGMGFMVGSYRGRKLVHHGGNIAGFSAELSFLPDDSIGVVVLTNMSGTSTRDFIPFLVYDRLLGLERIDWSARYLEQFVRGRARADSMRARDVASKVPNTTPSHPVGDYAGLYTHPGYGDIRITLDGGKLVTGYGTLSLPMEHWHYDVFETVPRNATGGARWKIQFHGDAAGKITGLSLPIEPAIGPTVFTKQSTP